MRFGKNINLGYKRAQSKLDYYNKKYGLDTPTKQLLSQSRKQYTKALREYNKGNISKSEVLTRRKALQTTISSIEKTYSRKSKPLRKISQKTQNEDDLTKYSRMLRTHNTFDDNAIDKFEDVASILNMDVDELLQDLYEEGRQAELFYKTHISQAVEDDRIEFESGFLEKYRDRATKLYENEEISLDELQRVKGLLS